jgi:hypothetical protein
MKSLQDDTVLVIQEFLHFYTVIPYSSFEDGHDKLPATILSVIFLKEQNNLLW